MNYKLRRFFRTFAIENIMTYVAATMGLLYIGNMFTNYQLIPLAEFDRGLILQGQIWRIVTFLFVPQASGMFWVLLSVYFYYYIGSSVENDWGSHELTLYLLTGYAMLLVIGFVTGYTDASYLYFSLFLVFAALRPREVLRIMMIIPVEAKWLAVIDAVYMLYGLGRAVPYLFIPVYRMLGAGIILSVLAAFVTFLIFFGKPIFDRIKNRIAHRNFINEMRNNDHEDRYR